MRLEQNAETTQQLVLWCMGEAHVDVLLDRLRDRYGVAVDSVPVRVSLRETFAGPAKGHGRHVKQSGGHGQFAVCDIEVEPLPHRRRLRVRRQGRRRGGAAAVHPARGEGRARADGAGRRGRLPGGRISESPSSTARRTRWTPPTWPSRPPARWRCGRPPGRGRGAPAGTRRRDRGAGLRRVRRRRDERPVRPSRPGGRAPSRSAAGRTLVRADVPQLEMARYAVELRSLSHGTATFARALPAATSRCRRRWPSGCRRTTRPADYRCRRWSGPGGGQQIAGARQQLGAWTWSPPTTGMKLVSPPHRGTTCWCRCRRCRRLRRGPGSPRC